MKRDKPSSRYKISKSQEILLQSLRTYRFLTSDLLAEIVGKDRSTIYERLSVLEQQGYIAKQYDKTYRLRQRPATYCLANAGIRYLKSIGTTRTQLHYKNKDFTEDQIDIQLLYAKLWLIINRTYPGMFVVTTKYESDPAQYIVPTPHLLLTDKTRSVPAYFLEVFPAFMPSWKIDKRLGKHVEAADEASFIHPQLLFVAGNDSTERRIAKMATEFYGTEDMYTTTLTRMFSGTAPIWQCVSGYDEDEEPTRVTLPLVNER